MTNSVHNNTTGGSVCDQKAEFGVITKNLVNTNNSQNPMLNKI